MNKLLAVLVAGLFSVSVAQAQDKKPAEKSATPATEKRLTAQQSKMGNCNKEAKEKKLKGDERKKFMSQCLKGGTPAAEVAAPAAEVAAPAAEVAAPAAEVAAPAAEVAAPAQVKPADQKQKMGYCNKEAKEKKLKGDERKKFMSACLKG
jgi:hypothetical protein